MNVADQITEVALKYPFKRAVVYGLVKKGPVKYEHYTFIQLEKRINQLANYFIQENVQKGDRVLVFIKPCLDFSAVVFALFKIGAVAVLIDPGMGIKKLMTAIEDVKPRFIVAIPVVHYLRKVFKKSFAGIEKFFSLGFVMDLSSKNIYREIDDMNFDFPSFKPTSEDLAAILFTSGGTGKPKGVLYTHEIFVAQTTMLQDAYNLTEEDVDVPGFPLFGLFTLAMGMTSVIPDMNPSRPSTANPKKLVQIINDQGGTFVAGSPAIWQKVADYCLENNLTLPTVRSLVMFGAPINSKIHEKFSKILTAGDTFTPYGATECLPITNISGRTILENFAEETRKGGGVCVGKPLPGVEVKMDGSEFLVHSKTMTKGYFNEPEKTKESKVLEGDKLWHRMGDVGRIDNDGNMWFYGRQAHVVHYFGEELYPIPIEAIFNQHKEVRRSALVSLGEDRPPGIVIERLDHKTKLNRIHFERFYGELFSLAKNHPEASKIGKIFLHAKFPVDVRHNIKIDRKALSLWAQESLEQK